jgi:hypothetical protein
MQRTRLRVENNPVKISWNRHVEEPARAEARFGTSSTNASILHAGVSPRRGHAG